MQGKRRDLQDGELPEPGEYGLEPDGTWYGCPPVPADAYGFALMATLIRHQVVEHEDKTITVSPSILIQKMHTGQVWHGSLKQGVWSEV